MNNIITGTQELKERFNKYIEKTDDCWIWKGGSFPNGYGAFAVNGQARKAHRVSWILHGKEIPPGHHVLHKCDVKNCVNPEHLFVGTDIDNTRDKCLKGRQQPGIIGGKKLNEKSVKKILQMRKDGIKQKEIAALMNLSLRAVERISSRKAWKWVTLNCAVGVENDTHQD